MDRDKRNVGGDRKLTGIFLTESNRRAFFFINTGIQPPVYRSALKWIINQLSQSTIVCRYFPYLTLKIESTHRGLIYLVSFGIQDPSVCIPASTYSHYFYILFKVEAAVKVELK